jgi:hypothetical protein
MNIPSSIFGEVLTTELSPVFQASYEYTVDNTDLNENTVVGTGTVTQSNAMAVVATGTTTASTAQLKSIYHARYRSGLGVSVRFTTKFSAPVVGCDQLIGVADAKGSSEIFENGMMIGYINGVFGFHRWVNDAIVSYNITDWSDPLDGTGPSRGTVDLTKVNIWYIRFGYLGVANPELIWVDQDRVTHRVFMERTAGTLTAPHSYNPNYHFWMWADNGATTSDVSVSNASHGYFIEGRTAHIETQQPYNTTGRIEGTTITTEVPLFTIRVRSSYHSVTNYIDIMIGLITAHVEASSAANLGGVRIVLNGTLGGVPSWSNINTNNSVVEIDTSATSVTGGKELVDLPLAGKNDRVVMDVGNYDFLLPHTETMTFAAYSANSATIGASCLWKELF